MLFTNTTDSETVDVWAHCEGPVNAVTGVYLNDDPITITGGFVQELSDGSYGDDKVLAGYNLGADPNTAHAPVVSRVADWTSDHRGDGIVSSYLIKTGVKSEKFLDTYPQGDNVAMSLVVEGHFCHDPRDGGSDPDDPATWPYTENAALHLLWFKTVFLGADYATRIAPVEQFWIDAADICDEAMALSVGGSEARYRGCVMFPADANPADVESEILATFDGWTGEDENGCIKVFAGDLYTPTVSIGASEIIDYELQEFVEDENRVNEIIVRHVSADHDFNEVECEPWRDDSDITARGKLVSEPLDLQVPSHTQARRLAKRRMARANAAQRGTVRVVFSARAALAERFVELTIEEAGTTFFDGTVEVIGGERDHETGGAIIEWVAVDSNVDAWNAATEDGDPAPTAAKFYLPPVDPPTITTTAIAADENDTTGRITVTFAAIGYSDVTWYIRWRVQGDSSWVESQATPTGSTLQTSSVPVNQFIEVEIAYSTTTGQFSDWSATATAYSGYLYLDFTGGTLPAGVTYTGNGGTGTRVNSAGNIVQSVSNTARFDFDPNTLASRGVLNEPARTNLHIRATELDNASWTKGQATVTANAATGPDGTASADRLNETAVTNVHWILSTAMSFTTALAYTESLYSQKGTGRYIQMHFQTAAFGSTQYANVDLQLGTVTASAGGVTVTVTDEGTFWRISYTATASATASSGFFVYMVQSGTAPRAADSYLGNTATNNLFWGFQAEQASSASSFIPTTTASVARTADAFSFTVPPGATQLIYTFDDDSTQNVAVSAGPYNVPTNLNRPRIKRIVSTV
jgi:hypothetical protein